MWQSVVAISRKVLAVRYSLLPYYYTLFYNAHISAPDKPSATVLRPVFFEFPSDQKTYDIYQQFMIGSGILVSPVLQQGEGKLLYDDYHQRGEPKRARIAVNI